MKNKRANTENAFKIIAAIVILALLASLAILVSKNYKSTEKKYPIEIIEITGECDGCLNVEPLIENVLGGNAKLKSRETLNYQSEEAKKLIEDYNIQKIPAILLLSKNIDKITLEESYFSRGEQYALFDKSVPYVDIQTGEIKGKIILKEIQDFSCKDCFSLSAIQRQLESWGIKIENHEIIDSSSVKGQGLIKENNLNFAPVLLISKDIKEYWWIFDQIKESLSEKREYYIFKTPLPPYKDISTGKTKGVVDITYIENKSCTECFDVLNLKGSFQSLGVFIKNEKYVDISSSEGKALLEKYKITAIPTIILSKDISDYNTIKETLEQVGTFESDGKFVFRELEVLQQEYQQI